MSRPLLSIIIPFYNSFSTIKTALHSVLKAAEAVELPSSSWPWLQLVCVDNASTDSSSALLLRAWEESGLHPGVTLSVFSEPKLGVAHARNCGLVNSDGVYIGFIDSDDTVSGEYFTSLLGAINASPDLVHLFISSKGGGGRELQLLSASEFLRKGLSGWWCCSFVTRASLILRYRFSGDCYEDFGFFPLVLSDVSTVAIISNEIYHYARSGNGLTSRSMLWRSRQWEDQYRRLKITLSSSAQVLQVRVRLDYLQNRIILRSIAGLPPVLGLLEMVVYLSQAKTLIQVVYLLITLIFRNAIALRELLRRRLNSSMSH